MKKQAALVSAVSALLAWMSMMNPTSDKDWTDTIVGILLGVLSVMTYDSLKHRRKR